MHKILKFVSVRILYHTALGNAKSYPADDISVGFDFDASAFLRVVAEAAPTNSLNLTGSGCTGVNIKYITQRIHNSYMQAYYCGNFVALECF